MWAHIYFFITAPPSLANQVERLGSGNAVEDFSETNPKQLASVIGFNKLALPDNYIFDSQFRQLLADALSNF